MELKIYPISNNGLGNGIPWSVFQEAFSDLVISKDPKSTYLGDVILQHPSQNIHVYIRLSGLSQSSCSAIHFDYSDVYELRHSEVADHPLWKGVYFMLSNHKSLLIANPPGLGTTLTEGIIVSQNDYLRDLPTWVGDDEHKFVCPTYEDFKRVIASGWQLSKQFIETADSKTKWASKTHDAEIYRVFENYITGKRGSKIRYAWDGRPVKPDQSSGTFLDVYGIWIDWRDMDSSVVEYFSDSLKEDLLIGQETETSLVITYEGRTIDLSIEEIGKERYNTIRAINKLIAPNYEIRAVRRSMRGDTHCFLIAPSWLWQNLQESYSEQLSLKVKVITETDGFVS